MAMLLIPHGRERPWHACKEANLNAFGMSSQAPRNGRPEELPGNGEGMANKRKAA